MTPTARARASMLMPCSVADLQALFRYELETGRLFHASGGPADQTKNQGYRSLRLFGHQMRAHRVCWALHHGEWPMMQVDHINCDRADNRISNLRLATNAQNQCNSRLSPRNKSGFKGVDQRREGKWRALIGINGKRKHLWEFKTPEEAFAAYQAAAQKHFGQFARPEVAQRASGEGGAA